MNIKFLSQIFANPKYAVFIDIGIIFLALILALILIYATNKILAILNSKIKKIHFNKLILPIKLPLRIIILTASLQLAFTFIHISPALLYIINKIFIFTYSVVIFGYLFYLSSHVELFLGKLPVLLDLKFVPLIKKVLQFLVLFIAFVYIVGEVFEKDIGAWLAGLGIAGLALSLAAQDSLKNFFGFITIVADQPFKIGDRIIIDKFDGTVEDIGIRSIKLRTFTGHLISIPNANAVNLSIENVSKRPYIRRILNVGITYDMPLNKVKEAIQIIKNILNEEGIKEFINPIINGEPYSPRVYFNDYQPYSLNIIVIYWYSPADYWGYMEHCEKVNLRLLEEFEKAQIQFAFPTQTIYLATGKNIPTMQLQNIIVKNNFE